MKKYLAFLIGSAALLMTSCKEDTLPTNVYPDFTTGSYSDITRTSAVLHGRIIPIEGQVYTQYGIMVSRFPSMAEPEILPFTSDVQESVLVSGLLPGTNYYYAPYAISGSTIAMGDVNMFQTLVTSAPSFSTISLSKSSSPYTSLKVSSKLDDIGSTTNMMLSGFIYKETKGTISDEALTLGREDVVRVPSDNNPKDGETMTLVIPDLEPGKRYAVRAYGVAGGVGYSDITYLTTETTTDPTMSSVEFQQVTDFQVGLKARLITQGNQPIVEQGFCYTLTPGDNFVLGNGVIQIIGEERDEAGSTVVVGSLEVEEDVTYYVRAYAKNSLGRVGYGTVSEMRKEKDLSEYAKKEDLAYYTTISNFTESVDNLQKYIDTTNTRVLANKGDIERIQNEINTLEEMLRNEQITRAEFDAANKALTDSVALLCDNQARLITDLQTVTSNLSQTITNLESRIAYIEQNGGGSGSGTVVAPTITIGDNGNWFIDGVDTGKPSRGADGANGMNGADGITPHIGDNGNWFIGNTDTGVSATSQAEVSVLQYRVTTLEAEIVTLKASLAELSDIVGSIKNVPALPVPLNSFTTTNTAEGAFTASCAFDYNKYIKSYTDIAGTNALYGDDYYAKLYPIVLTGFLYSTTNPEPNTNSYSSMLVATPDANNVFTSDVTGLATNTYYVRAFAINSYGVTYSDVRTVHIENGSGSVTPSSGDNPYPGTLNIKRR